MTTQLVTLKKSINSTISHIDTPKEHHNYYYKNPPSPVYSLLNTMMSNSPLGNFWPR